MDQVFTGSHLKMKCLRKFFIVGNFVTWSRWKSQPFYNFHNCFGRFAQKLDSRLWSTAHGSCLDRYFLYTFKKCPTRNPKATLQPQSMVSRCVWKLDCYQGNADQFSTESLPHKILSSLIVLKYWLFLPQCCRICLTFQFSISVELSSPLRWLRCFTILTIVLHLNLLSRKSSIWGSHLLTIMIYFYWDSWYENESN